MTRPHEPKPGRCSSCGAPILWAETEHGKTMPLDPEPERRLILGEKTGIAYLRPTFKSHFASCPNADKHRKPKPATFNGKPRHGRAVRPPAVHRELEFKDGQIVDLEGEGR